MALSKPVIATDCGGTREIVQNGINGLLVGCSVNDVVSSIEKLLTQPIVVAEMGRNAKQYVEEKFGIKRMVNEYICLYNSLV